MMKKKLLSCLLSLCMLLTMLPTVALAASTNPFTDVKAANWFYDDVLWVKDEGLMQGTTDTAFAPNETTTRGMIVTILWRMADSPEADGKQFADVAAGQYYADAVLWAAENNIVNGYGDNKFGPNDPITRQCMAATLYRYADWADYDISDAADLSKFTDADAIEAYAEDAMAWANAEGLITGVTAKTLEPTGSATRAQVAAILHRFCDMLDGGSGDVAEADYTVTFEWNYTGKDTYKTVAVDEGDTVTKPANPTRSGYSFGGWYTKATGGEKFDFDTEITKDTTLYAHWSKNSSGGGGGHSHNSRGGVTAITDDALFGAASKHEVKCSCGRVSEVACVFGDGVVETDGSTTYTCEGCGYTYSTAPTDVSDLPELDTENQPIKISTAAELLAFNEWLNGAADKGNVAVEITTDIDLTDITWNPIKVNGYHGTDVITVDGDGHAIVGLSAPLFAGGFAGGSGIVISNLTIADSDIVSTNTIGSGAFIESVDSMDTINLTNCHLLNSTVTGGDGSRTGGLIGWTAGYNNVNDGPVKTYVTISDCSVVGNTIQCNGSVGAIYGHAGNNAWTYSTVANCIVKDNTLISTDDGDWRVGVVVGTANVGEMTINNITVSGNTLTQTGKTAPEGQSDLYGRFVPGYTGVLVIDGEAVIVTDNADAVAVIGSTGYATLEEAVAAVAENGTATITLLSDYNIVLNEEDAQISIPAGKDITIIGATKDVALTGQLKVTGKLTLKDLTVKTPTEAVAVGEKDEISQYSKSAIALMNEGDVICEGVTFDMAEGVNDATAITAWWSIGEGANITVTDCTFDCAGQRPIRSDACVTVEDCTFNDPYRYAVQMTSKSSTMDDDAEAVVIFNDNTIVAGTTSTKDVVYGVQLEGETYGCGNLTIKGEGNAIELGETDKTGVMYYCECGKVDHSTIVWNTEVAAEHEDEDDILADILADIRASLELGEDVTMAIDVTAAADQQVPYGDGSGLNQNGGTIDGNGNTLTVTGSGNTYGIMTSGGTIKNLTIDSGCRAVMIMSATEDVILDNVIAAGDGVGYAINTGEHPTVDGVELIATDCTFKGWSSFAGIESASFIDCHFGLGSYWQNNGYDIDYDRLVRPYITTTFENCTFEEDFYIDLSALESDATVTFKNCTVNGNVITADNYTDLLQWENYDTHVIFE